MALSATKRLIRSDESSSDGLGGIVPVQTIHSGRSVTFTFKPDKGYHVKDVKVDGKSVGAVTTYTVDKLTVSTRIEVEFTNGVLPFTDVREADWFYDDVVYAYENGLFSGTSDTTFSPNASMTRAMLVTVLYRLEGQPTVSGRSGFSDVKLNSYYEDAVTWAADNGIVNGTGATTFSPNTNVTREQMAAILYRYAQYKQYGTTAIESVMNDTLTGSKDYSSWNNAIASLAGQTQPGNTAKLTIDSRIQTAAEQALKGFKGAVVVIDPRTGAVLACASSPTYDNTNIDALLQTGGGEDGSMYNRAMDALYTPGSTFKVVTLSAALETGTASLTSTYQAPGSMDIGNAPVTNYANESYGTISLQQAFAVSSNVVFGQVANEVGANTLVQFANAFGYGQKLGQDLTSAASIMADPSLMTEWETAWAGAGQPVGMDHTPGPQTTVMQNAVIAAAIANSGVVMDPYFVAQVLAPDGTVVKTTQSRSLGQAVSSATADQVKQAMLAVVQSGTGTDAQIPGVKVAGKTGSAETGGTNVNSMFVGFAPYDSPTVAISVALEDYDKHDVKAAKIAGIVLTAALAAQGA